MSLIVIVEAKIKPALVASVTAFMKKNLPDTLDFEECSSPDVYDNPKETGNQIVYQRWESRTVHQEYLA